jgi:CheY-like chemotaxis protein
MSAKILIIEDQYNNIRLIEQLLEDINEKIQVTKAQTGKEALSISANEAFDLVLTDIALPDMDGIQIIKQLKTYEKFEKTPFIAVTAYAGLNDEGAFRQVFDDYISKPVNEDLFIEKIKNWLGDKIQ